MKNNEIKEISDQQFILLVIFVIFISIVISIFLRFYNIKDDVWLFNLAIIMVIAIIITTPTFLYLIKTEKKDRSMSTSDYLSIWWLLFILFCVCLYIAMTAFVLFYLLIIFLIIISIKFIRDYIRTHNTKNNKKNKY